MLGYGVVPKDSARDGESTPSRSAATVCLSMGFFVEGWRLRREDGGCDGGKRQAGSRNGEARTGIELLRSLEVEGLAKSTLRREGGRGRRVARWFTGWDGGGGGEGAQSRQLRIGQVLVVPILIFS